MSTISEQRTPGAIPQEGVPRLEFPSADRRRGDAQGPVAARRPLKGPQPGRETFCATAGQSGGGGW
jgi:hypothetical protein